MNCASDPYADQSKGNLGNIDALSCNCKSGFIWQSDLTGTGLTYPRCVRDCRVTTDSKSSGKFDTKDVTVCVCANNYYWETTENGYTNKCVIKCSGAFTLSTHNAIDQCQCKDSNYVWSSTYNTCVRDCNLISNSPHSLNLADATYNSCNCNNGFDWNVGTYTNICSKDCSTTAVLYSSGTNVDAITCKCSTGYKWEPMANANQFKCVKDCSAVVGSTKLYDPTNINACLCYLAYKWDGTTCKASCGTSAIPRSIAVNTTDTTACTCQTGYYWNSTTGMCGCWPGYQNISNVCTNQCGTSSMQYTLPTTTNSYPLVCPCDDTASTMKWDSVNLKCSCIGIASAYNAFNKKCENICYDPMGFGSVSIWPLVCSCKDPRYFW